MVVVFDLDNTLFDTETRKKFFYELTILHGYDTQTGQEFYREARDNNLKADFTFSKYVDVLKSHLQQDGRVYQEKEAKEIFRRMREEKGLLEGAEELLKFCKESNMKRYLLSLGMPSWQEEKIQQAGIAQYFEKGQIIFTEDSKTGKRDVLQSVIENNQDKIILFNDRPDETRVLLEHFPCLFAFVRQEQRDKRYATEDFLKLEKDFSKRVIWATELKILHNHFKSLF